MTVNDIRKSGLLEYYVLGLLSEAQLREVEGYLVEFPELQKDLLEIQGSMQIFAQKQGVAPARSLKSDIIKNIRNVGSKEPVESKMQNDIKGSSKSPKSKSNLGNVLSVVFALATLAAAYFAYSKYDENKNLESSYAVLQKECDEKEAELLEKIEIFDALNNPKNRILSMTPTEAYQETDLIFHTNIENKKNYIQIRNLPEIADNQAFQLWSLKGGDSAPIPLTVFKDGDNYIVEVDFENGTGTYAITIEKEGGVESPTLSRLIGTVNV